MNNKEQEIKQKLSVLNLKRNHSTRLTYAIKNKQLIISKRIPSIKRTQYQPKRVKKERNPKIILECVNCGHPIRLRLLTIKGIRARKRLFRHETYYTQTCCYEEKCLCNKPFASDNKVKEALDAKKSFNKKLYN